MTHEELIELFKSELTYDSEKATELFGRWVYDEDLVTIIDALEKQMPKKPNNLEPDEVMLYTGPDWAKCPSCGAIFTRKVAYCSICGQAIDWSDYND